MRGLFTAGILDVLMERGVKFDGLIGVSAGACFGCNYKSGQIGRVIRYNKRFARDLAYIDLRVAAGKAVLIAPKEPLGITRVCHDPDCIQRIYDIGRKSGEAFMDDESTNNF